MQDRKLSRKTRRRKNQEFVMRFAYVARRSAWFMCFGMFVLTSRTASAYVLLDLDPWPNGEIHYRVNVDSARPVARVPGGASPGGATTSASVQLTVGQEVGLLLLAPTPYNR